MRRIAIPAALLLALSSTAFAQLAPKWDARPCEHNDNRPFCANWSPADDAMAKRFQNEPFVAPDNRLRPVPAK